MIQKNKERKKKKEVGHLAGSVLDYDVAIFANGSSLLRKSLGSSGVGLGVEVVLLVRHRCTGVSLFLVSHTVVNVPSLKTL